VLGVIAMIGGIAAAAIGGYSASVIGLGVFACRRQDVLHRGFFRDDPVGMQQTYIQPTPQPGVVVAPESKAAAARSRLIPMDMSCSRQL